MVATASTFSGFHLEPALVAAVGRMGITTPTPIQSEVIPAMLEGRDVVGQARTGSGKTLAFALPLAARCNPAARMVQALVLVPTRELAIQVAGVLTPLAEARRLKVTLLYGGRSYGPEKDALARGVHIVVGTPGRTLDHIRQGTLTLRALQMFVLDEGDEMLDRGFGPDVERILNETPPGRQMALLSATVPDWVMNTAKRHLKNPLMLQVDHGLEAPPEIEHLVYDVDPALKMNALRHILDRQGPNPIIVFGRTKHGVKKLARQLEGYGYSVAALQGNLSQNARERVMADFRRGRVRVLLATNVAARGLDIDNVEQVINYELPESAELFTHRAGRTGRMGKAGEAITFLTPEEAPKWRQIERALGRKLNRIPWAHTVRSHGMAAAPSQPSAAPAAVESVPLQRRDEAVRNAPPRPRRHHGGPAPREDASPARTGGPALRTGPVAPHNDAPAPRSNAPAPHRNIPASRPNSPAPRPEAPRRHSRGRPERDDARTLAPDSLFRWRA